MNETTVFDNLYDSERVQIKATKFSRHSFDRFGDDLCELLLSYLNFCDKIRFECVSLQWKRVILNRQESLAVYSYDRNKDTVKQLMQYNRSDRQYSLNNYVFERLLKKCPYIKKISIEFFDHIKFQFNSNVILDCISDNCRHLQQFYLKNDKNKCCDSAVRKLGEKCGKTLQYVTITSIAKCQMKTLLLLCPNIRSIGFDSELFVDCDTQSFLPKLNEIRFWRTSLQDLKTFPSKYYKQILKINFSINDGNYCGQEVNEALFILSSFENLRVLDLDIEFNEHCIDDGLKAIGLKCKRLHTLNAIISGKIISGNFLSIIGLFKSLKSFECRLFDASIRDRDFDAMKHCTQMSHFLLFSDSKVTDQHLEHIHLYLPNLTSLQLVTGNLSDVSLNYLVKLVKLSNIHLSLSDSHSKVTNEGFVQFIHDSVNIRTFDLTLDFAIDHTTIDAMIDCAERKPKHQHQFYIYCTNNNDQIQYLLSRKLPTNLSIDLSNY